MVPETGNAKDLALLLGISTRTVRELAERKIAVRATTRGTYDLMASVRAYCAHLRDVAAGRGGEDKVAALTSERARLAREQADAAALRNAVKRGALVSAEKVTSEWVSILRVLRSAILAVPTRVQTRLPHLSVAEVDEIDRELRDALTSLASETKEGKG